MLLFLFLPALSLSEIKVVQECNNISYRFDKDIFVKRFGELKVLGTRQPIGPWASPHVAARSWLENISDENNEANSKLLNKS